MSQPSIDQQREQQCGGLQRLHQHHRTHRQRNGLQGETGDCGQAAQPPQSVTQREVEQRQMADIFFSGDLSRGPLKCHIPDPGQQRGAQRQNGREFDAGHR